MGVGVVGYRQLRREIGVMTEAGHGHVEGTAGARGGAPGEVMCKQRGVGIERMGWKWAWEPRPSGLPATPLTISSCPWGFNPTMEGAGCGPSTLPLVPPDPRQHFLTA